MISKIFSRFTKKHFKYSIQSSCIKCDNSERISKFDIEPILRDSFVDSSQIKDIDNKLATDIKDVLRKIVSCNIREAQQSLEQLLQTVENESIKKLLNKVLDVVKCSMIMELMLSMSGDTAIVSGFKFSHDFSDEGTSLSPTIPSKTELPLDMVKGMAVVSVVINDKPVQLAIDTGASFTVITKQLAQELDLAHVEEYQSENRTATEHKVTASYALAANFELGDVQFPNHMVQVLDQPKISEHVDIDGVIGWQTLLHLSTSIDSKNSAVTFRRAGSSNSSVKNCYWYVFPIVKTFVNSKTPVCFGIDTGAYVTLGNPGLIDTLKLPTTTPPGYIMLNGAGGGGNHPSKIIDEVCFDFPSSTFKMSKLAIPDINKQHEPICLGMFGNDLLDHGVLELDCKNGTVDLLPWPT